MLLSRSKFNNGHQHLLQSLGQQFRACKLEGRVEQTGGNNFSIRGKKKITACQTRCTTLYCGRHQNVVHVGVRVLTVSNKMCNYIFSHLLDNLKFWMFSKPFCCTVFSFVTICCKIRGWDSPMSIIKRLDNRVLTLVNYTPFSFLKSLSSSLFMALLIIKPSFLISLSSYFFVPLFLFYLIFLFLVFSPSLIHLTFLHFSISSFLSSVQNHSNKNILCRPHTQFDPLNHQVPQFIKKCFTLKKCSIKHNQGLISCLFKISSHFLSISVSFSKVLSLFRYYHSLGRIPVKYLDLVLLSIKY